MLLPPLLSWMMMVQFNNATSSSSLKSSFLSCIFSIFVQSLQGGPTIFWDTFCKKKKKTFFNVTKGGQKIVKVCLHFSFLQVEEFFGDKRKKLSIQNLLRDPVFWLKIQLLFLSSYFFSWNWSLDSRFFTTWSRIHCRRRLRRHGPQHHQTLTFSSGFHVLMFHL